MAEMIEIEIHGRVGLIRLNRPGVLNALCNAMMSEVAAQLQQFENDAAIGAIILTGHEKAFAAGADIKEMQALRFPATALNDFIQPWEATTRCRKPVIAAVSGYALGGGCELAMMCDMIFASQTAQFAQPELSLGIIPGAGGTQRLVRAVGKAKAMDMILTGRRMKADEAAQSGLVARVFPDFTTLMAGAIEAAQQIAGLSTAAVALAKQAVDSAFETNLAQGVRFERSLFLSLFGTPDQQEGMAAFAEKRPARFQDATTQA